MNKEILLDMDGVIVEFVKNALSYWESNLKFEDVVWDFDKIVAEEKGISRAAFWDAFDFSFWVNLPWTNEGSEFFKGIIELVGYDRVTLCTSPVRTAGCIEGKMDWIRNNIPELQRTFAITPVKHKFANPNLILIDDNQEWCEKFEAKGGQSVLIPRPWNRRKGETQCGNFNPTILLNELKLKL